MTTEQQRKMLEAAAKASNMVTYDPEIGSMKWKPKQDNIKDAKRWNSRYANQECGTIDDKGYRRILFRFEIKKTFKIRAHRLAWYIVYGNFLKWKLTILTKTNQITESQIYAMFQKMLISAMGR